MTLYFSTPQGPSWSKVSAANNTLSDVEFPGDEIGRLRGGRRQRQICDGLTGTFLVKGGARHHTGHQGDRAKPGYLLDDTPRRFR